MSQRASAEYIADLLLGLRKAAQRNDLPFLVHLIEMAFYEAHMVAKQAEPDMSLIASWLTAAKLTDDPEVRRSPSPKASGSKVEK